MKLKLNEIYSKVFLFLLLAVNVNIGQWNFKLGTSQSYSNNPFNSPIPISSMISSFELGIERDFTSIGIGYYGNYSSFHNINERNYYWHQIGVWHSTENIISGLYFEQRTNTADYEYYDYTNYNAYIKYQLLLDEINIFSNAAVSLTDYSFLNDLDNILLNGGLILNRSFETKTTLIGGLNYNYKNYFSTNLNDYELVGDSLWTSDSKAFTSQINYFGRIAQSLTETTGLAVFYSKQNIIGGTANYIRNLEYVYGDESQYFDDPVSYEGYTIGTQLTQVLPEQIMLRLLYSVEEKDYPSQGIYLDFETFEEAIIRHDKQTNLNLSLTKYFYIGEEMQRTIMLSLSFQSTDNNSNSYWYNFKSNQTNLNFSYQF
jgi:hypothetical protein